MKKVMKDIFLIFFEHIKILHEFRNDVPFLPKRMKIVESKSL